MRAVTTFEELKPRLARSKFRSRFRLTEEDRAYIAAKGWETLRAQALKILRERLAPAFPKNDGRQTPMRGHVVFTAQHATGTCCRECLRKWHGIAPGRELSAEETEYAAEIVLAWLRDRAGDLSAFPRAAEAPETEDEPRLPGF